MEHLEFTSLVAIAKYHADVERLPGAGEFSIREQDTDICPMNYDDAIALAADGGYWADGADRMVQGVADAAALRENYAQPMIHNDVAGFSPDVPAYLAGIPDCMLAYEPGDMTTAATPTVTIGVGTCSYNVNTQSIENRGIAILSLIDALESIGYRVQLDYVGDNIAGEEGTLKRIRVILKKAGDHWNPGSVAFALCHPAMLRRLIVGLIERDPASVERTQCGYGKGDDGYINDYSLAFPFMTSNSGFRTLPDALATVGAMATDYGMDVNITGKGA